MDDYNLNGSTARRRAGTRARLTFRRLVERTRQVHGDKVRCPEPSHDDANPSCHIYDDHAFCFVCWRKFDAVDWLVTTEGMEVGDAITAAIALGLRRDDRRKPHRSTRREEKPQPHPDLHESRDESGNRVRRWRYHATDGQTTVDVVRTDFSDDKDIIRDPQGVKADAWLPLYPDEIPADGVMFVVEGEHVTDAVRTAGYAVTTGIGSGANDTDWRVLSGLDVIVVPDFDQSGVRQAQAAADAIERATGTAAHIVDGETLYRGMEEKSDLADFELDRRIEILEALTNGEYRTANGATAGRPRDANPTKAALMKRDRRARDAIDAEADKYDLPPHLRILPEEECDVARVLMYNADHLLRVQTQSAVRSMISDASGLWHPMDYRVSDRGIGATIDVLDRSRCMALAELAERAKERPELAEYAKRLSRLWYDRANHHLAVARSLSYAASSTVKGVATVVEDQMNDRGQHVVMPVKGGGAWSFKDARWIDADELRGMKLLYSGWDIPRPNPDDLHAAGPEIDAMKTAIAGRYRDLYERLSVGLLGPNRKSIDTVRMPQSNHGKTTAGALIEAAFPGSTVVASGKNAFSVQAIKFDAIMLDLAGGAWITIVDEVSKGAGNTELEIDSATITHCTNERLKIEPKGEKTVTKRRTSGTLLIGDDWPGVDVDEQGMATRLTWARDYEDSECGPMTATMRALLFSPKALAYLRMFMCEQAHEAYLSGDRDAHGRTPQSDTSLRSFFAARRNPYVAALKAHFQSAKDGRLKAADIKLIVEGATTDIDDAKLSYKHMARFIRMAFPNAKRHRARDGFYWFGIAKKASNSLNEVDDDEVPF